MPRGQSGGRIRVTDRDWLVDVVGDFTMLAELLWMETSDSKVLAWENFVLNACTRLVE